MGGEEVCVAQVAGDIRRSRIPGRSRLEGKSWPAGVGPRGLPARPAETVFPPDVRISLILQDARIGTRSSRLLGRRHRLEDIHLLTGLPLRLVDHLAQPIQLFRGGRLGSEQCDHHPVQRPIEYAVHEPPG